MIEFGRTLREAREAKGYSVSELAEKTHIMHQIVEDLENENFSRIAAPIYGRGFVKLYCEAVGLDSKLLVDEYMAILSGARAASIRVRRVEPAPVPKPEPAPVPVAPKPEPEPEPELPVAPPPKAEPASFSQTAPFPAATPDEPEAAPPPPKTALPPLRDRPAKTALPLSARLPVGLPRPPANMWRMAIVAAGLLLVLWGMVAGLRALYKATMPTTTTEAAQPAATDGGDAKPAQPKAAEARQEKPKTPVAPPSAADAGKTGRTPMSIPPLYID